MTGIAVRLGIIAVGAFVAASVAAGPLHDAVRKGDLATAQGLVAQGADIDGPDEANLTPLIVAALAGRDDAVAWLVENGVSARGRDGKGFTALHAAAHVGALDVVKRLMSMGLDVDDRQNEQELAPIHLAAERGHHEVAAALLTGGADVNIKSGHGRPAIWLAVLNTHPNTVKVLRDHGAKCPKSKIRKYTDYCLNAGN